MEPKVDDDEDPYEICSNMQSPRLWMHLVQMV